MAKSRHHDNGRPLWLPLYVSDYLQDTSRLTTEQHGAYLLILMDYWLNGPPPDDNEVLSRIARVPRGSWAVMRPVLARFFAIDGSEWRHGRLDSEYQHAVSLIKQSRDRASSGGRAKASRCAPSTAPSTAPSVLGEVLDGYTTTTTKKDQKHKASGKPARGAK